MKKIVTLPKLSNEIVAAFFSFQNEVLSYQECAGKVEKWTHSLLHYAVASYDNSRVTEITSKWYVKV